MIKTRINYPKDINIYLAFNKFKDDKKVYTNGADLIKYSTVIDAIEHYKNLTKSLYKRKIIRYFYCEDLDRYLIGKHRDGTNYYYAELTKDGKLNYRYMKDESWGVGHCPQEPIELEYNEWIVGWAKQNYGS